VLDDLEQSARYAMRDGIRGQNGGFLPAFLRYFKERLVFSLIITLVSLGIVAIVLLYVVFVVFRHL
jgi:hypothetical protein